MVRIYQAEDEGQMSRQAANLISAQVILKPDAVLGLATGSSPIGTYRQLVEWYRKGDIDFSEVKTVNLDEYLGLDGSSPASYRFFMNEHLFDKVNIDVNHTHVPNGMAEDIDRECRDYDRLVQDLGGVDLQLLGLGHNGHIGFNEPGDAFENGTHVVELTESTINANARLFARREDVPRRAITMGVGSILRAKKILVIVSGEDKARAVRDAFFGPVTPRLPASILQLHRDVVLIADRAALRLCRMEGRL